MPTTRKLKVPRNRFGIVAVHSRENIPFTQGELLNIINGPVAAVEDAYQEERKKVVCLREIFQ
jgi:hypothetical protein